MIEKFIGISRNEALYIIKSANQALAHGKKPDGIGSGLVAVFSDDKVVLHGLNAVYDNFGECDMDDIYNIQQSLISKGVKVVPIIGYIDDIEQREYYKDVRIKHIPKNPNNILSGIFSRGGYILMQKAKGKEINQIDIASRSSISQKHYDKYVKDFIEIRKSGIFVDIYGPNIFYDKAEGFSFIDLRQRMEYTDISEVISDIFHGVCMMSYKKFKGIDENTGDEIKSANETIFRKLVKALDKQGYTIQDVDKGMINRFMYLSGLDENFLENSSFQENIEV